MQYDLAQAKQKAGQIKIAPFARHQESEPVQVDV
jgi:hypothetical protein